MARLTLRAASSSLTRCCVRETVRLSKLARRSVEPRSASRYNIDMKITKIVDFAAAHSIVGAGKCENKHGHNWEATISVELYGDTDYRGFIVDVAELKKCAFKYDHDDLDRYFAYASTENVAQKIADDVAEV